MQTIFYAQQLQLWSRAGETRQKKLKTKILKKMLFELAGGF